MSAPRERHRLTRLHAASTVTLVAAGAVLLGPEVVGCSASPERTSARADPAAAPASVPRAARGPVSGAVYEIVNDGAAPRMDRLVVETHPARSDDAVLVRAEARSGERRLFAFEVGTHAADFLRGEGPPREIVSYAVALGDRPPRSFFDRRTGRLLLPRLGPDSWLPLPATDAAWRDGWFDRGTFLGRTLRLLDETPSSIAWAEPERVHLDEELQIATSRDFRDDGTGRHRGDWRWVPFGPADYERLMRSGFNLFRALPRDLAFLIHEPVFLVARRELRTHPGLPLLPGYRGAVMYVDEPAIRARRERAFRSRRSPADAAADVAAQTTELLAGQSRYGSRFLDAELRRQGVSWGTAPRDRAPVWESIASAAWYELEAGAAGWCYQARLDPERFASDVRRSTGVSFPPDPAACIDLHVAAIRGAARRFDAPWGVSVYGQMDPATADVLLPRAYDAGASMFWFWTSDHDHHVPHARQLELAERLSAHARAHPRTEGAQERTRAAQVALVLPWGYTLDDDTFRRGGIWGVRGDLSLDRENRSGVTHARVLAAAMGEAAGLVAQGAVWDMLFLRDAESATGYREVHRVDRTGQVRVTGR